MNTVNDRSHLSIGEVLSLLQDDFPDVSISKIRFLESQGLLDPERTPSGYRKFYETDIARLRWILRQQRENFLPLKVIKDRLARGEVDLAGVDGGRTGAVRAGIGSALPEADRPATPAFHEHHDPRSPSAAPSPAGYLQEAPAPDDTERPAPRAAPVPPTASMAVNGGPGGGLLADGPSSVSLTDDELSRATGLSAREIGDLERFGMITSRGTGATPYYDEEALTVARLAAAFRSHGVEARHLRMYKMSAQREVGLFEQLLLPILRKHSTQARREAADVANELASLGDSLRSAMLRQQLRDYIDQA